MCVLGGGRGRGKEEDREMEGNHGRLKRVYNLKKHSIGDSESPLPSWFRRAE